MKVSSFDTAGCLFNTLAQAFWKYFSIKNKQPSYSTTLNFVSQWMKRSDKQSSRLFLTSLHSLRINEWRGSDLMRLSGRMKAISRQNGFHPKFSPEPHAGPLKRVRISAAGKNWDVRTLAQSSIGHTTSLKPTYELDALALLSPPAAHYAL